MKGSLSILLVTCSLVLPLGAYKRVCVDQTATQNVKDTLGQEGRRPSYVYTVVPSSFFTTGTSEAAAVEAKAQGRKRKCFVYVTMAEITAVQEALEDYDDNLNLMVAPLPGIARKMADDLMQQNEDMTVGSLRRLLARAEGNSN